MLELLLLTLMVELLPPGMRMLKFTRLAQCAKTCILDPFPKIESRGQSSVYPNIFKIMNFSNAVM